MVEGFGEHKVRIAYHHRDAFPGWNKAPSFFAQFIDDRTHNVLEVGCGPNPTLPLSMLAGKDLRYVVSDLFMEELEKAPPGYDRRVLDLENPTMPEDLLGRFDLIISRMVNEHISDGERYHRNILSLLRHGGRAVHCSASLFTLPLLANKLIPGAVADKLLDLFAPRNRHQHDRFTAYYGWCRGPTQTMIWKFQSIGYKVLSYDGYFGHEYYREKLPALHALESMKSAFLVKHPNPHLCSYVTIVLERPSATP